MATAVDNGYLKFVLSSAVATGEFIWCYAVVVDNQSNDGVSFWPRGPVASDLGSEGSSNAESQYQH